MTDRLEALSPLGIGPAARPSSSARVKRDERNEKEGRGRRQEQEPPEQHEPDDTEDDGRLHVDVRA